MPVARIRRRTAVRRFYRLNLRMPTPDHRRDARERYCADPRVRRLAESQARIGACGGAGGASRRADEPLSRDDGRARAQLWAGRHHAEAIAPMGSLLRAVITVHCNRT